MKNHLKDYIELSKTASVRGLRILLEYFYALEVIRPIIASKLRIVSVFGSARQERGDEEYNKAKEVGKELYKNGYAVVTGASKGIMEAANEGVSEEIIEELKKKRKIKNTKTVMSSAEYKKRLRKYSVGLKISLPFEPASNPYVGVLATFHYFMVRKFFFATLSSAFIACEGGWGTRDELFEMLTLVQTGKSPLMPIIYITSDPKHFLNDLNFTLSKGYIHKEDMHLLDIVDSPQKAIRIINRFYRTVKKIDYDKSNKIEIYLNNKLTASKRRIIKKLLRTSFTSIFTDVVFSREKIVFYGFRHQSYGHIRKIIDVL